MMRSFLKYVLRTVLLMGVLITPVERPESIRTVTEEAEAKPLEENLIVVVQSKFTPFRTRKKNKWWTESTADHVHAKIAQLPFVQSSSLFLLYRSILI